MAKSKRRKKILITGGAGFVGSMLILKLQNEYDIVCVERGAGLNKFKKLAKSRVSFVKADVSDEAAIRRVMRGIDVVIHLAGGGGNVAAIKNPLWAFNTHVKGTSVLAECAARAKTKKFIFASTYQVLGPFSFYSGLKSMAESIIAKSGLNYSIIRFSNVYGYTPLHKLQSAGAINNFIHACLQGKAMRIQGSGKQTIDYVHIQDAVDAIISVLKKGKNKSIYNIGSSRAITIIGLAKKVQSIGRKLYKKDTQIKKTKSCSVDSGSVRISIQKARKELEWNPRISLENGIEEIMLNNKSV